MNLQPDMFLSKWHLIAVVLTVIAWIGLIAGKYDRKTILRSGLSAAALFYVIVTLPVVILGSEDRSNEELLLEHLEDNYRIMQANAPHESDLVVVAAGTSRYKRDRYHLYIYAGNYSKDQPFKGTLTLDLLDSSGDVIDTYTLEDVELEPGEKKRLKKTTIWKDMDRYTFRFEYK